MATLTERIAARAAELEKIQSKLSDDDRQEIEQRAQLAKLESDLEDELQQQRDLDLDRRLDTAISALGETARIRAISIEGFEDTFVLVSDPAAHAKWVRGAAQGNGKEDRIKLARDYAVAVVYDWNGNVRSDEDSEFTVKLAKYLTDNPGIVTPITNVAIELAGVLARERKR